MILVISKVDGIRIIIKIRFFLTNVYKQEHLVACIIPFMWKYKIACLLCYYEVRRCGWLRKREIKMQKLSPHGYDRINVTVMQVATDTELAVLVCKISKSIKSVQHQSECL